MTDFRGDQGFGYDPIFQPIGWNKSFAEVSTAEKNNISHRSLAFKQFLGYLHAVNKI
jgi:XTP/dITP diphosphohydrolase